MISRLVLITGLVVLFLISNVSAQLSFSVTDTSDENLGLSQSAGLLGCAWGDYDDDGDLDVFISGLGSPSGLFRNDIADSNKFTQVSGNAEGEGILFDAGGNTNGAVWADLDGDGDLDLATTNGAVAIFRNDDGTFVDVSADAVPGFVGAAYNPWCIAAADYNGDGWVDLAISGPEGSTVATQVLFNLGDGTFTDDTDAAIGFDLISEAWVLMFVDVDNDYDMDLFGGFIRTDEPNALLINDGSGYLEYGIVTSGDLGASAISGHWGDFDNDGDVDLFIDPFSGDNDGSAKLFQNNGDYTFTDIAADLGIDTVSGDSRGACWGDVDNDGDLDLLVGRMFDANVLLINDGGTFTPAEPGALAEYDGREARTAQFVDYDNDGRLDGFFKGNGQLPWLAHNDTQNDNNWIVIRPKGAEPNTAAIGARVEVTVGDVTQVRYVEAGAGGMTNGQMWPHFGLGGATTIDNLTIYWDAGTVVDEWINVTTINQYLDLEQGSSPSSIGDERAVNPAEFALYQNFPNPFNPTTTIAFNLEKQGHVTIELISPLGEVVKIIASGNYNAGMNMVQLDASDLSSGVYFYKLTTDNFSSSRKLILIK